MQQNDRLHEALAEALSARGYVQLTPVQSAVVAQEAGGRDLIVSAKTGSGKTVAFGMAMAEQLFEGARLPFSRAPLALVIAPTRELAIQVSRRIRRGHECLQFLEPLPVVEERAALAEMVTEIVML